MPEIFDSSSSDPVTSQEHVVEIPTTNQYSVLEDEAQENNNKENKENLNSKKNKFHTKICESETVILCDSNGRMVDTNRLCPNTTCTYFKCPTLSIAKNILEETLFEKTQTVILHCATNDLETAPSNESLVSNIINVVDMISQKLPQNCKIIVSSLLPRLDKLHQNVGIVNQLIKDKLLKKANVHFVTHNNLFPSNTHLRDNKHLNRAGFLIFAKNLKSTFYHIRKPNHTLSNPMNEENQQTHHFRPSYRPLTPPNVLQPPTESAFPNTSQPPGFTSTFLPRRIPPLVSCHPFSLQTALLLLT